MIKINGVDLKTSKPADLDEQLVAATGCASQELEKLLASGPDLTARALRPFIGPDVLPGGELAASIAADRDAVPAIRNLYLAIPSIASAVAETQKDEQHNG